MSEARASDHPTATANEEKTPTPAKEEGEDALIGHVIGGRFKVLRAIARGGMGKVYLAEQSALGRNVAVKVLSPHYEGTTDAEFHKRFMLEAAVCAKLSHPNIVTIFDYGKDENVYYIVMELLEGRNLRKAIAEDGPFAPDRAISIAVQVCRALRESHKLNIIHRDLKPANIYLVDRDGDPDFVKILDFGLVKEVRPASKGDGGGGLTKTGLFMGSPKYMAPEQIRRQEVDVRVDIYALGVVLYQMLCGKVPFEGETDVDTLTYHLHRPVPPMAERCPGVSVPPALEHVVRRALAKSREDRYADMNDFIAALRTMGTVSPSISFSGEIELTGPEYDHLTPTPSDVRIVTSDPIGATLADDAPPRRSRLGLVAAGIVAVAAIAGGVYLGIRSETGSTEHVAAERQPEPSEPAAEPPQELEVEPEEGVEPTPTPPVPPPIESRSVTVVLRSEPAGARVIADNGAYGPTPASVVWTGYDARPGRVVTFLFQKEGYQDYSVTRRIEEGQMDVEVRLEPLRQRPRVRPPSTPMEEPRDGLDFRNSPY